MKLEIQDLQVDLAAHRIVDGVSMKVEDGQFVGILGPNGSGKSTLLQTVYRIRKQCGGVILLDNKLLQSYRPKALARQMAVVGQFNHINFDLSVEEIVMLGRGPHLRPLQSESSYDQSLVYDSLMKVGMSDYAKRSFQTLSGGEKQRIILARALVQEPTLLILDEPTNHLDITYQLQILGIIKKLGINVLAALHDLSLASQYCDHIYILKHGRIDSMGTPKEVINQEMIRRVYEVNCEIIEDQGKGKLIRYFPLGEA